jgi:RNA polymerase sigma-70 factor (ECF subfamily)
MAQRSRHPPRGAFPTTRWSLVGRAGSGARPRAAVTPGESDRAALAELVRIYLPALRAHLLGPLRLDADRADDLLQGFLADKVLEQNLVALADPNRGKFRTFLLTALERFAVDVHRHDAARRRAPEGKVLDVDVLADRIGQPARSADAFDRAWAGEVLSEVMRRLRDECHATGRAHLWDIFEARMLLPLTDGRPIPSHEALAGRCGLASATQSANALGSAKRLFTKHFRAVVGEYARDPTEADEETRELWAIFSASPA